MSPNAPRILTSLAALTLVSVPLGLAQEGEQAGRDPLVDRALARFTGDLPEMQRDGVVRVLTSYSKTSYFVLEGTEHGFEVELMHAWLKELNAGRPKDEPEIKLAFVPVPFDELIPALVAGQGDVIAAGMTITRERAAQVAFSDPYLAAVDEVVVAAPGVAGLERLEDLGGRVVHVVRGSSFAQHLRALSRKLEAAGTPPIEVVEAEHSLEAEDLLELVNTGVLELTVCDRHVAALWSSFFGDMSVRADLAVSADRSIAWAARRENPELLASLSDFARRNRKGSLLGNVAFKRYYESTRWIANPLSPQERAKMGRLIDLFRRVAPQYGFDWLQLGAQAYQESRLDPNAKSAAGAVGLMQLMPATAKDMGCTDRSDPEQNVVAGAKYMAWLRDTYFSDPAIEPGPQFDLCLAAYNAGPGRVRRWRKTAAERGLDPNRWFGNVERIALEKVGSEPVRYVGNVNKYYLAYRLGEELVVRRWDALGELEGGGQ